MGAKVAKPEAAAPEKADGMIHPSFGRRLFNILLLGCGWCCAASALFIQVRFCFAYSSPVNHPPAFADQQPCIALQIVHSAHLPPPLSNPHPQNTQISNTSIAATTIPGGGPALATIPVALFIIAAAATVLPGAFAMRAFGRQPVVLAAAGLGLVGACLELLALYYGGFGVLNAGALLQVCSGYVWGW